ncbi:MAG: ATP-binding protein [Pseudomonadota bacterium]
MTEQDHRATAKAGWLSELRELLRAPSVRWALVLSTSSALLVAVGMVYVYYQAVSALTQQNVRAIGSQARVFANLARQTSTERVADLLKRERLSDPRLRYRVETETGRVYPGGLPALDAEAASSPVLPIVSVVDLPPISSSSGRPVPWAIVSVFVPERGTISIGRQMGELTALSQRMRRTVAVLAALFAIAAIVLALAIAVGMRVRLQSVRSATRRVMAGDLGQRLPLTGDGGEVDRMAETVNEMLARIEVLMASLREVSDNIAHDLRTPLNRLRVRAEHALRERATVEGLQDALAQTIDDADALMRTFTAMLLVAKLESGRAQIPPTARVDLRELISDVVELYQPIADDQSASIEVAQVPFHAVVKGDRQLIGQAITNLVENALKYGAPLASCSRASEAGRRPPHRVQIEIVADETPPTRTNEPSHLRVVVSDRGRGIAEADRTRALKRFVRLDDSRTKPGSGLGLSLVAAIARAHGGSLELADNAPGLRVTLTLPEAEVEPKVDRMPLKRAHGLTSAKIIETQPRAGKPDKVAVQ